MGVWCSGNMRVSKTPAEGSIPSTPVYPIKKENIWKIIMDLNNSLER